MYTAIFFEQQEEKEIFVKSSPFSARFNYYTDLENRWVMIEEPHVTLWMGECDKELVNKKVSVVVDAIGASDKAIAFRVKKKFGAEMSKNETPHITLWVNKGIGGKPVDSNKITNWTPIEEFELEGYIKDHV